MVDFGGKLSFQSFVDRDGLLDDNFFLTNAWIVIAHARSKEQDRIRAKYGPLFKIQSITWNDKVYFGLKEKKILVTPNFGCLAKHWTRQHF